MTELQSEQLSHRVKRRHVQIHMELYSVKCLLADRGEVRGRLAVVFGLLCSTN